MEAFSLTVTNLESVIFFLSPGFLFIVLFFYQIPDRKKSDFTIVLWSVVFSVLINNFNLFLLALLHIQLDPNTALFQLFSLLLSIIYAFLAAMAIKSRYFIAINYRVFGVKQFPFGRLWNHFFNVKRVTIVRVTLQDGTSYIGQLRHYSVDPDDVQELEIFKIYSYNKATAEYVKVDETESMLIRGDTIATIEKISRQAAKELYKF